MKTLLTFTVQHRRIRLKVALLPSVPQLEKAFTGKDRPRRGENYTAGFFSEHLGPSRVGTVFLAANFLDRDTVIHEVAHAVHSAVRRGLTADFHPSKEEQHCMLAGALSDKVLKALDTIDVSY